MGLHTDLSGIIPENLLLFLSDGYEIIGTIAIITVPPALTQYHDAIISALLARRPSLVTILNKVGIVQGLERTTQYIPLYGQQTITEHKEFGFRYTLDIGKVYFSTKMAFERRRIAEQISSGESVFVPFAGVGPYAIPCAARNADVIAMEISKPACFWMAHNTSINKVTSNVQIIQGDALHAKHTINRRFSRIICPSPYGLLSNPDIFLPMLKEEGTIHWITFCNVKQIATCIDEIQKRRYEVVRCHRCGNVAPSVSRWILDIRKN
jgi:tRNA (guanine37-N1)-methyltransferase